MIELPFSGRLDWQKTKMLAKARQQKRKAGWPFPRATLEEALKIPYAIKDHNGGNPWEPDEVRKAVGAGTGGNAWFYLTAASRDYGLTTGTNTADKIALTDLGREIVYAPNADAEKKVKVRAFLNVDIFKRVLEYYKGSNLPDMTYLGNTLKRVWSRSRNARGILPYIPRELPVSRHHVRHSLVELGDDGRWN
jgi:hypothetical protein